MDLLLGPNQGRANPPSHDQQQDDDQDDTRARYVRVSGHPFQRAAEFAPMLSTECPFQGARNLGKSPGTDRRRTPHP